MGKVENILTKIIRVLLYAAVFSPLVTSTKFIFPYYAPGIFFFELIVSAAAVLYGALICINSSHRPKITHFTIALAAFFAVQLILLKGSIDPIRSFMGSAERMSGAWNIFHYLLFAIIASNIFRGNDIFKLIFASIAAAVAVSIEYIIQRSDLVFSLPRYALGNPGFLANYITLSIPLVLLLKKYLPSKFGNLCYLIALVFAFISIYTGNRAAFLGLIAIAGGIALHLIAHRGKKHFKKVFFACTIVIAAFVLLFTFKNTPLVKNNSYLAKLTTWSLSDSSIQSRFSLWKIAYRGISEKPLAGWGRENFYYVFERNYIPSALTEGGGDLWNDKVHNVFLEELVAGGLINGLAMLALATTILIALIRIKKTNPLVSLFASLLFLSYIIQGFFTIDTLATYLPLALAISIIGSYTGENKNSNSLLQRGEIIKGLAVLGIMTIAGFSFFFTFKPLAANYYEQNIERFLGSNPAKSDYYNKKLISLYSEKSPLIAELSVLQGNNLQILVNRFPLGSKGEKQVISKMDTLVHKLERLSLIHKYFRTHLEPMRALILNVVAQRKGTVDSFQRAINAWEDLIAKNPGREHFYINAGFAYTIANQPQKALEYVRKASEISPNNSQFAWELARRLLENNFIEEAAKMASRAVVDLNHTNLSIGEITSFAATFAKNEKTLAAARDLYILALNYDFNNVNFHANLIYVYAKMGDGKNAQKEAEITKKLAPERSAQIDEFLQKNLK